MERTENATETDVTSIKWLMQCIRDATIGRNVGVVWTGPLILNDLPDTEEVVSDPNGWLMSTKTEQQHTQYKSEH